MILECVRRLLSVLYSPVGGAACGSGIHTAETASRKSSQGNVYLKAFLSSVLCVLIALGRPVNHPLTKLFRTADGKVTPALRGSGYAALAHKNELFGVAVFKDKSDGTPVSTSQSVVKVPLLSFASSPTGVPVHSRPVPARGHPVHRQQPVCPRLRSHLSREDRVCRVSRVHTNRLNNFHPVLLHQPKRKEKFIATFWFIALK